MQEEKTAEVKTKGLSKIFESDKYKNIIIIAGLLGIALIFLSGFFKSEDKTPKIENESLTTEQYTKQLENSLTDIVSNIYGAGESKVLVTIESGAQMVYATGGKKNTEACEDKLNGETTKVKESDDSVVEYITIKDSNGTEKALAITEIQPTIKGVVVVCAGGDDPNVKQRIVSAVTTALNITSKRVCVTKLS